MTAERPVDPAFAQRPVEPVLAALNEGTAGYRVVRKLPDGAWGAWLVADSSASFAVLKCVWDADWRDRLASAVRVVSLLADRGAPAPRYLACGYEPGVGTWYLQEHLGGERVSELTPTLLAGVFELNALQAGLGARAGQVFDWSVRVAQRRDDDSGWREAVVRRVPEADGVVRRLAELTERGRAALLDRDDLVHGDLLVTQLLAGDGMLTGVLDWDAAGRGDRGLDLALLLYNVFAQADRRRTRPSEEVVRALGERGSRCPASAASACTSPTTRWTHCGSSPSGTRSTRRGERASPRGCWPSTASSRPRSVFSAQAVTRSRAAGNSRPPR